MPQDKSLKTVEKHLKELHPDLFEGVGKDKKAQILQSISYTLLQSKSHSGPLPDPATLKEYNELISNGAERIMEMAEKEQFHRHKNEVKIIDSKLSQSKKGQIFGFFLGVLGLSFGTLLSFYGQPYVGGIIAGTTVISLVSVFVLGNKKSVRK